MPGLLPVERPRELVIGKTEYQDFWKQKMVDAEKRDRERRKKRRDAERGDDERSDASQVRNVIDMTI